VVVGRQVWWEKRAGRDVNSMKLYDQRSPFRGIFLWAALILGLLESEWFEQGEILDPEVEMVIPS
jgi:hypothetical protein